MNRITLLLAALFAVFTACNKENKPEEEEMLENLAPTGLVNVQEGKEFWNQTSLSVDAQDADGTISEVSLYANNLWVGVDSVAPYEFIWDTRDFDDGEVELKAVITDNLEAQTEVKANVKVLNTLIDYHVLGSFLEMSNDYKYYTYVTSAKKEILFFSQIETEEFKSTVTRPETFNDTTVDVHFVQVNGLNGKVITYNDIYPGIFAPVNHDLRGKKLGNADMKFTNVPDHDYFTYFSSKGEKLIENNVYSNPIYSDLNLGYLYLRVGEKGWYKLIKDLKVGDNEESLAATGFQMEKHTFTVNEPMTAMNFNVFGHTGPDVNSPAVQMYSHFNSQEMAKYETSFHLPTHQTETFHHFSSWAYMFNNTKSHFIEKYFGLVDKIEKLNATIELAGYKMSDVQLTISNSDPYDMIRTTYSTAHNSFKISWESVSGDTQLDFPIIPSEIVQAFPKMHSTNYIFKDASVSVQLNEYDHIEGYENYLKTLTGRTGKTIKQGGTQRIVTGLTFNPLY